MSKTFCVGDIHGGYKALKECLIKSKFDYNNDRLICLGDVVDGWPDSPQCIEELLKIKNLVYVMGNHDVWCDEWFKKGTELSIWLLQGGRMTWKAYMDNDKLRKKHSEFFTGKPFYFIDEQNRIYVHGGFIGGQDIKQQTWDYLVWDRDLINGAIWNSLEIKEYKEVFLGHTSIWRFSKFPMHRQNIWMLDTGGGYEGRLTIMDVDTKEFFQSEKVSTLYPNYLGRGSDY
jgi:serine/threonine protein phosphatase 1